MICNRCKKETGTYTMSIFNTELICMNCKEKERKHPLYKKAKEIEHNELMKHNYNFEGIGKPKDL